jgi:hypothetical protein
MARGGRLRAFGPARGRAARMARRQHRHTRNLRCMHDAPQDVLVDAYPKKSTGRTC